MRNAVLAAVATLATSMLAAPAYAGGIGFVGHGGIHTERVFYYSNLSEGGSPIDDPQQYPQFRQGQVLPQFGGGLEFILGDRDDKIIGVFRAVYNMDTAQRDPKDTAKDVNSDNVVSDHRAQARHVGIASMGLNWGIIGNTDSAIFGFSAHVGSGFLTTDHNEFFQIMVGPTMNYRVARQASIFVDLQYLMRVRKDVDHGAHAVAGLRYMFD